MIADHKGEIPFVVLLLPFLAGTGLGIYYPSAAFSLFLSVTLYSFAFAFILLNLIYQAA
jgi:competence protein ComEC